MGWLIIIGVIGGLLYFAIRLLAAADPRLLAKGIKWVGATIFCLGAILFAVLGRFSLSLMLGGAAAFLLGVPEDFLNLGQRKPGGGNGGTSGGGRAPKGSMTREEALEVLGLSAGASADEIREAHKRLIKQFHPDQGGSDYLAAKVNLAKDVLLGN